MMKVIIESSKISKLDELEIGDIVSTEDGGR